MTTEESELERLQEEAAKARKVAVEAQAIADERTDEAQRYAAFVLAKHGIRLHFPNPDADAPSPRSRPAARRRGAR